MVKRTFKVPLDDETIEWLRLEGKRRSCSAAQVARSAIVAEKKQGEKPCAKES